MVNSSLILVRRETHGQSAPASASQHISTTNNQKQPQQQPLTPPQQQPSTTDHKCAVTTRTTTSATVASATTAATRNTEQQRQQLFHQAVSQTHHLPHRGQMLAHRKVKAGSNNSCNKNDRHVALNSMVFPSQRQVTQGPQSQPSDTEQQA